MHPRIPTRSDTYVACTCGGTMCIVGAEHIPEQPLLMHQAYKCVDCGKVATFEVEKKIARVA